MHSTIAQHTAKPVRGAISALHNVFRYVKSTRDFALAVPLCCPEKSFTFFTDSDHAANRSEVNHRRSQLGALAVLNGAPIYWKSTVQSNARSHVDLIETPPVTSVGEAETMALSNGLSAFQHLQYVASEMHLDGFPQPIRIATDSATAEAFASGSVPRSRLKHIDVRQAWVVALRNSKICEVFHISGEENPADIFTKIPTPQMFAKCRDMLCIFLDAQKL